MTEVFNSYYMNIVEKSSGTKPKTFGKNFENTAYSLLEILSVLPKIIQALLELKK